MADTSSTGEVEDDRESVAGKVSAILLLFTDGGQRTATEISRQTSLPLSTAHRLASELATWGFLERVDGGVFRPGLVMRRIVNTESDFAPGLDGRASGVLDDVAAVTKRPARIGVLRDPGVEYVEKVPDHLSGGTTDGTSLLPAHATALGKALLAFASPQTVDQTIRGGLESFTAHTITSAAALHHELRAVRRSKVALASGEFREGVAEVAVPVFGPGGVVVAALSVETDQIDGEMTSLVGLVQIAASSLSRRLTHQFPFTQ